MSLICAGNVQCIPMLHLMLCMLQNLCKLPYHRPFQALVCYSRAGLSMADVRLFWALHLVLVTVGTAYLVCLASWGITHGDLAPHQRSSSVPEWFGRGCHSATGASKGCCQLFSLTELQFVSLNWQWSVLLDCPAEPPASRCHWHRVALLVAPLLCRLCGSPSCRPRLGHPPSC